MNTKEIKIILENNLITNNYFINVFPLDKLPIDKISSDKWFLVCNRCPSNKIGMHWIVIFYQDGILEFFDSFGFSPYFYKGIKNFLILQGAQYTLYNDTTLQSLSSDSCGHHCILFGFLRCRGESFSSTINQIKGMDRDSYVKFVVNNFI